MRNLSELLLDRAARRPEALVGTPDELWRLDRAVAAASGAAGGLARLGLAPGRRLALVGSTSTSFLLAWMGATLAGLEVALVNPEYPAPLLTQMFTSLEPHAVLWLGLEPVPTVAPGAIHLDGTRLTEGTLQVDGQALRLEADAGQPPGVRRASLDVAGYMHTSGTTGVPKFCAQTHHYFLSLGRFVADTLGLTELDTVFAPLPFFHINPLGYGLIGGLSGLASVVGVRRFSASGFWPTVRQIGATALILHAPPVEILKRATTWADADGHRVRGMFYADADFLERFRIPFGVSAYGSTEAGGLSHVWVWRRGDRPSVPEGSRRYGGRSRHDLEWRVADDGEILVRGRSPGVLFAGYRDRDGLRDPLDADGWFATGDIGRVDELGNLVFIERRSESARVKGEFVPLSFVEEAFAGLDRIDEIAVWKRPSAVIDDELILYVVGGGDLPVDEIRRVSRSLPAFMRPVEVVRVAALPRDSGVGKLRRRELSAVVPLERISL